MGTDKLRVTIPTPDHSDSSRSTSSSVSRLFILNCGPCVSDAGVGRVSLEKLVLDECSLVKSPHTR